VAIHFRTLQRWYEEMECLKNEANGQRVEKAEENTEATEERPVCYRCHKYPVFLTDTGKPLSRESKDYGLCGS
jgi:hypothetical protein